MFELHPRLVADTVELCRWPLSHVLLMNDSRYPWLLLVPARADIEEPFELPEHEQAQLGLESMRLARFMRDYFTPHKLNIAALGNVVAQLHIHHIARYRHDDAWPSPVWGRFEPLPYADAQLRELVDSLRAKLQAATNELNRTSL